MRLRRRPPSPPAPPVRIVDLPERHVESYFVCLEDWSSEMTEARDLKQRWFEQHRERGLRVKLALDDDDRALGMIQYLPIESSPAQGDDLYMILCIWVHGYGQGVGDVQGAGIGSKLLAAAEADVRELGALGLAAWGLHLPVWMKASWFKRHGYRTADRIGARELVWKPFSSDADPPRWVEPRPLPAGDSGAVDVRAFCSGWCPAANLVHERARRASDELGDDVSFVSVDTTDRVTQLEYGRTDEVLVDGRPLQRGAPPSYAAVRRRIARRQRRLRRSRNG
ncbi:GNAT family N-acetyltransferase [Ilumatobacter sp.]|uniref:GNAT family N-acetyltransferase n=1 Tax=Ilumatobacter sp. TaxID=1967498 RepID=UPI003AF52D61